MPGELPAELKVDARSTDAGTVLAVSGEVDRSNAGWFRTRLEAAGEGGPLTIDLTAVTYLDSSGVAILFDRLARGDARLVAGPGCLVRRVLEVTGLPLSTPDQPGGG